MSVLTKKMNFMANKKHEKSDLVSALRETVRVDSMREKIRSNTLKAGIFYPENSFRSKWELFITM